VRLEKQVLPPFDIEPLEEHWTTWLFLVLVVGSVLGVGFFSLAFLPLW
jgi:hypothetical protein